MKTPLCLLQLSNILFYNISAVYWQINILISVFTLITLRLSLGLPCYVCLCLFVYVVLNEIFCLILPIDVNVLFLVEQRYL